MANKIFITIGVILMAVTAIVGFKVLTQNHISYGTSEQSRTKGNPNSKIKIVEYMDLQCPMCALGAKKLKEYLEKYPEKIYIELHYFPLDMHKHALMAAQYAQCAAEQDKFWVLHDVLVDQQKSWSEATNAAALFDIYAKEIGLDMSRFKACVPSDRVKRVIEKDKQQGRDLAVRSTPTYFINGKMVVGIKLLEDELGTLLGIAKTPTEPVKPQEKP